MQISGENRARLNCLYAVSRDVLILTGALAATVLITPSCIIVGGSGALINLVLENESLRVVVMIASGVGAVPPLFIGAAVWVLAFRIVGVVAPLCGMRGHRRLAEEMLRVLDTLRPPIPIEGTVSSHSH